MRDSMREWWHVLLFDGYARTRQTGSQIVCPLYAKSLSLPLLAMLYVTHISQRL